MNRRLAILLPLFAGLLLGSCEDLLRDSDGVDPRDRLVDTWKVDETPGKLKSEMEVYWVEISKHPYDTTKIVIYNFFNVDANAEARLSGSTLTLPQQELEGGYSVRGQGQVQGNKSNEIIWTYTVDDGSGIEEGYTAVYTRYGL